ncbi:hypothetical protein [Frigoribacterium endophyticum]|uniref:hypothetical protein n=1 Tax=Frigoribacterium endophyticum TaxID=1522176 RepID=UPI001421866E|nr:hypothetical protein [Frigoribacterium endophyticum]NII49688.1 hypothetical protein [Frigoribacterium endophyticum]
MTGTNTNEPHQGGVTDETAEFGDRTRVPVAGSTENHGDVETDEGAERGTAHLNGRDATGDVMDRSGTVDSDDVDRLLGERKDDDEGPRAP